MMLPGRPLVICLFVYLGRGSAGLLSSTVRCSCALPGMNTGLGKAASRDGLGLVSEQGTS